MIDISDCTKKYGDLTAVDNLTLKVGSSEILGLIGPNGAGKSTTIKMMVGLISPDAGIIKISGYDISRDPVKAKSSLAYIPEKSGIFNKLTAWEYLRYIGGLYRLEDGFLRRNAEIYLTEFGLMEWKDETVANFSMGMKQRLVLASALMREPRVLILDEPHNGLDPKGIRLLKDILFKSRKQGMTILLSTHIIALADEMCDRIAIVDKGTIVAQGNNKDLRNYAQSEDKTLEDVFLRLTAHYDV